MGIYPYILSIEIYLWFCFGQVYQGYPYRLIVAGTLSYHPGTQPLERCLSSMLPFNKYLEWSPMVMFSWKVPVVDMDMDQYLLIPFLGEWTSIYQLFWCSPGVQGFDTLPYAICVVFFPHWRDSTSMSTYHPILFCTQWLDRPISRWDQHFVGLVFLRSLCISL